MKRAAFLIPLTLSACAVGPNYRQPTPPGTAAPTLAESAIAGVTPTPLPGKWWQLFDDPNVDRLVEKALANNTDLRVAAANLQRARGALSEARAGLLPTGSASAQYTHQQTAAQPPFGQQFTFDFFTTGYDASYEVDLFGGVSRSIQAARADWQAAQAQVDASRVSVAAETARAYATACSYANQAQVARESARLQSGTLDLTQRLFDGGRGTRRDVDQARVLVEQANAQVPTFEAERRAALYALAVLTGDPPEQVDAAAAACTTAPVVDVPIPIGDGRTLLARRPDVRAAERKLAGDVARVGVATADLYPSIKLLGAVNVGASKIGDLGKPQALGFSFGPLISWNIPFNGAARARVRQATATANASLASFDGAVLTALQETEQALARLGGAVQREEALRRAVTASDDAARLSRVRFDAGADSFLQLLDAERQRETNRAALAQASADRVNAQVSVFKALGGGWENAPPIVEKSATR